MLEQDGWSSHHPVVVVSAGSFKVFLSIGMKTQSKKYAVLCTNQLLYIKQRVWSMQKCIRGESKNIHLARFHLTCSFLHNTACQLVNFWDGWLWLPKISYSLLDGGHLVFCSPRTSLNYLGASNVILLPNNIYLRYSIFTIPWLYIKHLLSISNLKLFGY